MTLYQFRVTGPYTYDVRCSCSGWCQEYSEYEACDCDCDGQCEGECDCSGEPAREDTADEIVICDLAAPPDLTPIMFPLVPGRVPLLVEAICEQALAQLPSDAEWDEWHSWPEVVYLGPVAAAPERACRVMGAPMLPGFSEVAR